MGAGKTAVVSAQKMIKAIGDAGKQLGLDVKFRVPSGQTIWATKRHIKVVLSNDDKSLGVECFCQEGSGTANQKAFAKILDIQHWPIPGILVFDGPGLKEGFRGVLVRHGAIPIEDLEERLRTHFNVVTYCKKA